MANTEGNTYDAKWEREGRDYVAWLVRRPRQRVRGRTEEELCEQLWEIALNAYGDGEACINLEPPLPVAKAAAGYFEPEWFRLSNNEGFHRDGPSVSLYREGQCSFCRAGLGGRNDTERVITGELKGHLGFVWWVLPSVTLVSDPFLAYLRRRLKDKVRAFPCRAATRPRKQMWELELTGEVAQVCHRDATHNDGVVCPRCGTARFGGFVHPPIQKGYSYAISRADLPRLKRGLAIAEAGEDRDLIVDRKTAADIKARGFKGVLFDRLALLPPREIGRFKIRKLKKSEVD